MLRSIHVLGFALATAACAQPSQSPAVVTAPSASVSPAAAPSPVLAASAPPAAGPTTTTAAASPAAGEAGVATAATTDGGVDPQFRACQADSDCVAVPRAGCCNNGWKEAVAVSQKDAYAKAGACPRAHPICPMYRVRDGRVAKCDTQAHLCTMVQP